MPSIGSVNCSRVSGEAEAPAQRLEIWQIPGQSGIGVHRLNLGPGESVFRAINFSDQSGNRLWLSELRALIGQQVTIENDQSATFANMIVVDVGTPDRRNAVDGNGVTVRWEVIVVCVTG